MSDLKFALRQLLKSPGFTAVAVVTLALGIGANTGIFSVINAVMLRPLPFPHPERLFWIEEISKENNQKATWGAHFLEWREQSQTLERIAAYDNDTRTLIGSGEPEQVKVALASVDLLPLLGVQPVAPGRGFSAAEDKPGGGRVAILSYSLWQRRYNGSTEIIGKSITLNDVSFSIIGVLPESFHFFQHFDVWVPLALDAQKELTSEIHYYGPTIARVKPGVGLDAARSELDTLLQRTALFRSDGYRAHLIPLRDHLLGDARRPLFVLLGAVALVLLIACANVANLLLARAVTRERELAIRSALGASRWHLIRQMLNECVLLALSGGAAGFLLAYWLVRLFQSLNLADVLGEMARLTDIRIDLPVFGFALFISLATGSVFALLPTFRLSRPNLDSWLREGTRSSHGKGNGLRRALLVGEVAMAIVLLAGAGLLMRSFAKLIDVNPGYQPENLLTAQLRLPPRYDGGTRRAQFYDRLLQRLAALPGVEKVGATSQLPLTRYNMGGTLRGQGATTESGKREIAAPITAVNSDYFPTMKIRLRSGRLFNLSDVPGGISVVLLSESLAQKLFPDVDPVGRTIFVAGSGAEQTTVVGVVDDIRHQGLDHDIEPTAYLSYRQLQRPMMSLVLRTKIAPLSLASAVHAAVTEIDPALPIFDVSTMDARLANSLSSRRFNLILLGTFAALALLLADVGVYGVIAYLVSERTREVGIRMALGAGQQEVIAMVLVQGMKLTGIGLFLGVITALSLTQLMTRLLFDVTPHDPLTFAGTALILALIALLACWLPARRAARVDPASALRAE